MTLNKLEKEAFPYINKLKEEVKFEPVKTEVLNFIKLHHKYDLKLYNFAKQLFDLRYNAYII